jgi:hypothetical protein
MFIAAVGVEEGQLQGSKAGKATFPCTAGTRTDPFQPIPPFSELTTRTLKLSWLLTTGTLAWRTGRPVAASIIISLPNRPANLLALRVRGTGGAELYRYKVSIKYPRSKEVLSAPRP